MEHIYYFDNNATTCISKNVSRTMAKICCYNYGNPSSIYPLGREALEIVENSRKQVAELFLGNKDNVIFTSGATEANNAVIHSALMQNNRRKKIVVSSIEHPSVWECVNYYKKYGYEIITIPASERGINFEYVERILSEGIALFSVMTVNNETGMIFPADELFRYVKEFDSSIICHSDCVQAVGKTSIPVKYADYLTISAHKFHGPKGIGCIFKKEDMKFEPLIYGGGQEKGKRSGTENTVGIAGMGIAAKDVKNSAEDRSRMKKLQLKLEDALSDVDSYIVCKDAKRVPGVTNVGFKNVEANQLLLKLSQKRIFVSTGSACSSGKIGNSAVIEALMVPKEYRSTIRISMSRYTCEEEVDYLIKNILESVNQMQVRGRC